MRIGIDVGYGDTKYVCENGLKDKFPTAIHELKSGVPAVDCGQQTVNLNGKTYVIGEDAVPNATSTRSPGFLEKYAPAFVRLVLKRVSEAVNAPRFDNFNKMIDRIGIGVPLGHYESHRKGLLTALKTLPVDGLVLNGEVEIYPQGTGCLIDYVREDGADGGYRNIDKSGIVIDGGYNTVDVVNFKNGRGIMAESDTLDKQGISVIILGMEKILKRDYPGIAVTPQELIRAFQAGSINIYGKPMDLGKIIEEVTSSYFNRLMDDIQDKWDHHIQKSNVVVVAGGLGYYFEGRAPEKYRGILHVPEDPEFSNARGFLKALVMPKKAKA